MKKSRLLGTVCICVISMSSHAALIPVLGGHAYYDDVADRTWLQNANTTGETNWADAQAWAAGLDIDGVDDWRLPDTLQPDPACSIHGGGDSYGYNCTGSELGDLFYNVLGGVGGQSINTTHNSNYGLFTDIQAWNYWSATPYTPIPGDYWVLYFGTGSLIRNPQTDTLTHYAWAVRTGGSELVPIPPALWLFGSGLLGLVGMTRRKAA